jgi:hypothetical protein
VLLLLLLGILAGSLGSGHHAGRVMVQRVSGLAGAGVHVAGAEIKVVQAGQVLPE